MGTWFRLGPPFGFAARKAQDSLFPVKIALKRKPILGEGRFLVKELWL
jgi:hypothetical protein